MDLPPDLRKKLLGDADTKTMGSMQSASEALDNSLDPERYLVGGGDRFQISIVGLPSQEYTPVVDPEGNLYDGDLGIIPVGKLPLSKAKIVIADKVKKSLRKNYEVYVALKRIKTSTVTVTGLVTNPGTISLAGNLRILDALKQANGGALPSQEKFNLRRVRVRNGDTVKEYDLLRFLNRQDMDQNPYLYPGDLIALDQIDARIYIAGEVRDYASGWVPLKPGETAGDLFALINMKETADSSAIMIQHSSGGSESSARPRSLSEARGIVLANNDFISIGAKLTEGRTDTVKVTGEVKRPGTYPVVPGADGAAAIVALAGGPSDHGSSDRVFILRHRKWDDLLFIPPQENNPTAALPLASRTRSIPMMSARPEMASSVIDLSNSGDFTLIDASGKAGATRIEDGDEIYVPRKETCIYVSGNVRQPGAYPFVPGAGYGKYIDAAKGYTNKADSKNMYVMTSYRGVTQVKGMDNLAPGDIIVVPAAIEYKRWTNVFMPIIQLVPAVLSLAVTLLILSQSDASK